MYARKVSILRRCKLEEVNIPFQGGQELSDISLEDLESARSRDDMDIDGSPLDTIKIDYAKLRKEYKQVILYAKMYILLRVERIARVGCQASRRHSRAHIGN